MNSGEKQTVQEVEEHIKGVLKTKTQESNADSLYQDHKGNNGHGKEESEDDHKSDDESEEERSECDDEHHSIDGEVFEDDFELIRSHPCYAQVMLDVNRCAGRLEHIRQCYFHRTDDDDEPAEDLTRDSERCSEAGSDYTADNESIAATHEQPEHIERLARLREELKCHRRLKKKLASLIVKLLIKKPDLHYYQGFHDVCLTYMTLYGDKLALEKLDKMVDSHFIQFMRPTMLETQEFLAMIPIIIGQHDHIVQEFLDLAETGTIFALSWTITWFSHVIPNERDVEAIFTYLEELDDPHVILYLCAAVVIHKREKLLSLESEMSTIHHFLCQVPRKERLPIQDLLRLTDNLYRRWPPELIKKKLDDHRRVKLQVQNYNIVQNLAQRFIPTLTNFIGLPTPRTAIVVLVLASALAFNFDKWVR